MYMYDYSEEYKNSFEIIAEFLIAFFQFMFSQSGVTKSTPITSIF